MLVSCVANLLEHSSALQPIDVKNVQKKIKNVKKRKKNNKNKKTFKNVG